MSILSRLFVISTVVYATAASAHYERKLLETMAYSNPPPSKIYNHPAIGMKHRQDADSVSVISGTPRAYQRLGASLFYGPYFYTPRDREPQAEWQVPQ
jgi:hypothetical protein